MIQYKTKDAYTWRIAYQDGGCLDEYDEIRTDGRGWAEREAKPVQTVSLLWAAQATEAASITLPDGATPVFFRRRTLTINPNDDSIAPCQTVHCIGWKRGDKVCYLFVFDDGRTLLTDNLQAV